MAEDKQHIQRIKATFKGWILAKPDPLVPMPDYPIEVFIDGHRDAPSGKISWTATITTGQMLAKDKRAHPDKLKEIVKQRFREQVRDWEPY